MLYRILISLLLFFPMFGHGQKVNYKKILRGIETQTRVMLVSVESAKKEKPDLVAPRTLENGKLKMVASRDWTSGFFAGQLWQLFEATGNGEWKKLADSFTRVLEREKFNGGTHDMGFKMYPTFGAGYRLTNDAHYREVLIQSAKTLITRYNRNTGTLRSWDHNRDKWGFPVIIDNMMNLELLFAATRLTGDSVYYKIAVSHADQTMRNHFRSDFSSYHVVDYDTITGAAKKKQTHQGFADESHWARGQAWGLYGYTMCYRETKDPAYLQQAEHIAQFLLNHPNLPADKVPYWDLKDPSIPDVPRDASAAAIMSSALYELCRYSGNAKEYRKAADKILASLTKNYRAPARSSAGFILLHSTGHKPANSEIDVPINYADYYYIEALMRSKK
jgi:unsaturated chondroitin disaccharide hydrolase